MTELLKNQRAKLYQFILRRVRDPWLAEDLAQETIARLLSYATSKTVEHPTALGHSIALNLIRDHFRAHERCQTDALNDDLACHRPAPDEVAMHRQHLALVHHAIGEMPALRRDVFMRNRLRGETPRDIAKALDLTHAAVEKHIVRAGDGLRHAMAKHDRAKFPANAHPTHAQRKVARS